MHAIAIKKPRWVEYRMRIWRVFCTTALLVVLVATAGPARAAVIVLDDFADATDPGKLSVLTSLTSSQTGPSGVFGGARTTTLAPTGSFLPTEFEFISSVFRLSSAPFASATVRLDYTNIETLDLSSTGSFLGFDIEANDNGGTFELQLTDGVNTGTASLTALGSPIPTLGPQQIAIQGNPAFTGVSLSDVTSISFIFNGNLETDIDLDDITLNSPPPGSPPPVVPEPSSVAVWTLMALGSVFFASRRREKSTIARR